MRAFVSYAKEDRQAAQRVAEWLRARGAVAFVFEEEVHRGGPFVRAIEDSLRTADVFLVLLSPAYLSSSWCRRERDLAVAREEALGHQFIYVLEIAPTVGADLGFLQSYNRLDGTGSLDGLAAALPLDISTAPVISATSPSSRWKPVVITAAVIAVIGILGFALWPRSDPPSASTQTQTQTSAPATVQAASPGPAAAASNVLNVTPDKPSCSSSYLVKGVVRAGPDRSATAIWLVDELYASASHNDPNDLYFAKVRLTLAADGSFEVRIPANSEAGARDSRLLLVASPTPEADLDLAKSLRADQAKDGSYPDVQRTRLQLGNVEIATSPDLHQAC